MRIFHRPKDLIIRFYFRCPIARAEIVHLEMESLQIYDGREIYEYRILYYPNILVIERSNRIFYYLN